jgi:hypothetical protein
MDTPSKISSTQGPFVQTTRAEQPPAFRDETFDILLAQARRELTPAKWAELYRKVDAILS